jgi:hypothetical protein
MPRFSISVRSAVLAAVLGLTSCSRENTPPAGEPAPARAVAKKEPKAPVSPIAEAQRRLDRKDYGGAVRALGTDRSAEALEFCLGLLALDAQQIIARNDAVQLLAEWPEQHERIVAALAAHLERAFWPKELEAIARVFAKWGGPAEAVKFAQFFATTQDMGLLRAAAHELPRVLDAASAAVVLDALPMPAEPVPAPTKKGRPPAPPAAATTGRRDPGARVAEERGKLALEVLGHFPTPAGIPKFTAYLNANNTHIIERAAIALGRTGDEQAVATLERLAADKRRGKAITRLAVKGLWHAPHPRGRALVVAALTGSDRIQAHEAAGALVASATAADGGAFARGLATPWPHARQRLLAGLEKLPPAARASLVPAAAAALQAGRPRTARTIAEAAGEPALAARAQAALEALKAQRPPVENLGRWLGKTREELQAAFPDLKSGQEIKSSLHGDLLITSYGPHFVSAVDGMLRFYSGDVSRKVVRVLAWKGYTESVGGVGLGEPADRVWELHGPSETKTTAYLEYTLDEAGRQVSYTYHIDAKGIVISADVRVGK